MVVILVGGGKVGTYLAELLLEEGHRVRVVENQPNHLIGLKLSFPGDVVVEGSGDDPDVLERAGIRQADVIVAVTGCDETNLVVTNLARFEFHVPTTVARVNNPKNRWLFSPEMGVDVCIDQANVIAHLLLEELSLGEMTTLLKLRKGQFALVEERVDVNAFAANRTIAELNLPPNSVISAVLREKELVIPHPTTLILPGDEILALVPSLEAPRLAALLGAPKATSPKESSPNGATTEKSALQLSTTR